MDFALRNHLLKLCILQNSISTLFIAEEESKLKILVGDRLGFVDGEGEGDFDGESEGDVDGETEGDFDGETEGDVDGETEGRLDGETEGGYLNLIKSKNHYLIPAALIRGCGI